jgi:DNA-binding phage protein
VFNRGLSRIIAGDDAAFTANAPGKIARAKGMTQLANEIGLRR